MADETPQHRYNATLAQTLEAKWQTHWDTNGTFNTPNPVGDLSDGFDEVATKPKAYVLDMFPYPSGAGLHVGHPLGYIGTDVYARYLRMTGHNVVHTMGYDSFGLPAEQYALQTNTHPRVTTENNIANMERQLQRLGLAYDRRRSVSTTDEAFYRWTQWIFLQIFESWYDSQADRARPISELVAELDSGSRQPEDGTNPFSKPWAELDTTQRRSVINAHRLAYVDEVPVNWCPGLGTVLANEEVTADGRSERGDFPVFRRPMKQWMLRITAYADRLLADLDLLDWSDAIKSQQRNWIGRSTGAVVKFSTPEGDLEVFTTRPDTLFGATYMVLSPEHPLVDGLTTDEQEAAVAAYVAAAKQKTDLDRHAESKDKTGVFTGSSATNPVNGAELPIYVADYVLMGYGTGAIMAVPAHDTRDWDFAKAFDLPIVEVVSDPAGGNVQEGAFVGEGVAVNSSNDEISLDGLAVSQAKEAIIDWLSARGLATPKTQYKLRDWLFSRQRYWGEPFPIVYGDDGEPQALPDSQLPLLLPPMEDFSPKTSEDENSEPEPPLGRVEGWSNVELDLGEGVQTYRRELNTMPNWAGSCWYELRYLDPTNANALVDPANEKYWMGPQFDGDCGGVDLYVGGVEHAVLHLLYARFWHKVLFDLGHVSSLEPFRRLFNQGMVQAHVYRDARGFPVPAAEVAAKDGVYTYDGAEVSRELGKMGKSLKNSVAPDEMCELYGADTLRLYEMFGGPLDQSRPWDTTAVVGMYRMLQRVWRVLVDEDSGELRVSEVEPQDETLRQLHRTIASVRDAMETMRFNTAIARITELTNHLTATYPDGGAPRDATEALVLMLAPLAPHIAEELWARLGNDASLSHHDFPVAIDTWLVDDTIELPVSINGKLKARIQVGVDASPAELEDAARADERVAQLLEGATIRKVIAVPNKMVNFVVG